LLGKSWLLLFFNFKNGILKQSAENLGDNEHAKDDEREFIHAKKAQNTIKKFESKI
jgi:hypothetical protein